jgi:hypothetical protein
MAWPTFAKKRCRPMPSPAVYLNVLSIAPIPTAESSRRVRITHPFHPLSGQQFDLIEQRSCFGASYLYFEDDCGRVREIPAVWTDFVKGDAWVELAAGRSPLHAQYLLELADGMERKIRELGQ